MTKEESSSLFDLAGKMQKKKEPPKEVERAAVERVPLSNEDLQATFERCRKMHEEIKNRVESAYDQAKVSPRRIQEYVNDPKHFPEKVWKEIQATKNQYEEQLKKIRSEFVKAGAEAEGESLKKEKVKQSKGTFISRKRWLSTH